MISQVSSTGCKEVLGVLGHGTTRPMIEPPPAHVPVNFPLGRSSAPTRSSTAGVVVK